jgi:hypothetical protein
MGPPQQQGSSAWKYILIGCGVLLLVGGLITVGTCVYMAKKAPDLMNKTVTGAMGMAKTEYLKQLTGDHTDKQKDRFSQLYDAVFTDEVSRLGVVKWGQTYSDLIDKLNQDAADGQITVDESDQWCDDAYNTLEANGYWEENQ